MSKRDFTSAEAKEAILPDKENKYCGKCCWFYGEDSYGYGFCPHRFVEMNQSSDKCSMPAKFVSIEQMRRYLFVLLEVKYWFEGNHRHGASPHEIHEALSFAYKYIKIFSNL